MSQESIYGTCLWHARRCLPADPALEPQDLVQMAYLKVGARLDTSRSDGEQAMYLCQAITQVAIDCGRKARIRPRGQLPPLARAADDTEREALVRAELAATLDRPGIDTGRAILLALGFTHREIAAREGITIGGAKVSVHRARNPVGDVPVAPRDSV